MCSSDLGDIVNVDLTTIVNGWFGDQSETFMVGDVSDEARRVTQCAFDALYLAIEAVRPDCQVAVIGETIVSFVSKNYGFGVVELTAERLRVITRFTVADPSAVRFGDAVELCTDVVGTDDDGTEIVTWAFRPTTEAAR